MEDNKDIQIEIIKEKMNEAIKQANVEELLKNNILEFIHKEIKYRLKRPTAILRQEVYVKRAEKHIDLLTDSKFKPEEILKKLYKNQGIDIDEIDKQIIALEKKKNDYKMKLGEGLKKIASETEKQTISENELNIYKEEIEKIKDRQQELSIKKTNYLEFSIENQVNLFTYSYFACTITEKEENGKWIRAFKDYDEYLMQEEELLNAITIRASALLLPSELLI